ncbi:bifunctional glycosyltransferase/CDP-glycerol:glycerophosphate glycerophosphotransferase [Campylobacter aviculae]|uniref:Glycosyltransferase 2-like domain-containing protein n=1 Tax=Campylobacter aviculae TaxID=2510190 RepID=A0A4U7BUV8_9BACT|nr:CDP-glycerol glycerophosphotransferase family protein [Campylobacter aviculae]TKX32197.1 hypothetical protein CQA76_04720 [Campylobacter aviculae]
MFFSIVIPAYNSATTIGYTLESIISQSFTDFEIIIVNDGSTDNLTLSICEKFKMINNDKNITIISKENGGLCSARNKGIENAQGEVLIFLDSDDLLPEKTLENYYNIFQSYDVDVVQGKLLNFNAKKQWKSETYEKTISFSHILDYESEDYTQFMSLCINPCNKAIKKKFILENKIFFLNNIMMTEDHYFLNLLNSKNPKVFLLNQYTLMYRRDNPNQSTNIWKPSYLKDILAVQKELNHLLDIKIKDAYYKRFFDYEFKKFIFSPIIGMRQREMSQYCPDVLDILKTIPQEYKDKYLDFKLSNIKTEKELLKALKKIKFKKIFKDGFFFTLKKINKIKNYYIKGLDWLYSKLLGKKRLNFVVFMYNVLSLLIPIKNNKITFAIRPKDKLKFLKEIKEEVLSRNQFAVKTLLAKKIGFFEDLRIVYHLVRSKVIIIDGHYWYLRGVIARKNQIVIQSWHACGLGKKFGLDIFEKNSDEYKEQLKHHSSYSYTLVSSDIAINAYMSAFNLKKEQILTIGNILSDRIINNKKSKEQAYFELGIDTNKKLVLYAPTFREDVGKFTNIGFFQPKIDFEKLSEKFGHEYIFACRIHSNYKDVKLPNSVLNLSQYDEATVLSATEILITDYSSIVFSFLHFKRPIILFAYDLPIYMGQRNMYLDYEKYFPGYIVYNQNQLSQAIEQVDRIFDKEKIQFYWDLHMQYCDGKTAVRLVDFIEKLIKREKL